MKGAAKIAVTIMFAAVPFSCGKATTQPPKQPVTKTATQATTALPDSDEWKKAAVRGNADCQCILGYCYENGEGGLEQNQHMAVKWYRQAAEQGESAGLGAQCALGFCYANGEGVKKDLTKAVMWYRKAADQGYPIAQYMLGACYEKGDGVEKDSVEATNWYHKAADQGNEAAKKALKAIQP